MPSRLLAAVLLLGPAAAAGAATIQDLVKLKAAGLSDDILIALIESDGSVFQLKADDVISLKKQGLSEKVIMAMLVTTSSGQPRRQPLRRPTRTHAAAPDMPVVRQPAPQVFTDPYQTESATQVVVPQPTSPVVINVTQTVEQKVEAPTERPVLTDVCDLAGLLRRRSGRGPSRPVAEGTDLLGIWRPTASRHVERQKLDPSQCRSEPHSPHT